MKLRTRFVIIMAGFILMLTALATIVSTRVVLAGSLSLEKELVREAIDGGRQNLISDQQTLRRIAEVWSKRGDVYSFMSDTNPAFISANLVDGTFRILQLNVIAFCDRQGHLVHGKGFDLKSDTGSPIPESFLERLRTSGLLQVQTNMTGLLPIGNNIWLIALEPVLTSQGTGPSPGSLIMARRLESLPNWCQSRHWHGLFSLRPIEKDLEPVSLAIEIPSLSLLRGLGAVRDIEGRPTIVLEVLLARRIFAYGITGQFFLMSWILLSGASIGLFAFWVVDRWVLQGLTESLNTLKGGVAAVATNANPKLHLKTARTDEMGELTNSLNEMLTALDNAQQASEKRRRDLIQAQKMTALGTLVAGVTHEINNPNTVIGLNLTALRRRLDRLFHLLDTRDGSGGEGSDTDLAALKEEAGNLLTETHAASARIAAMVSSLKAFARPAAEKMDARVDVNNLIKSTCSLMKHIFVKKGCTIRLSLAEPSPVARGNEQQLSQVLMNLIDNACDACSAPGAEIAIRSENLPEDGGCQIIVKDPGRGIPPELQERIFEPFFTTRRDHGGTGLGLSISVEIVRSHGGRIDVDSTPGQGSTFTVVLPGHGKGDS